MNENIKHRRKIQRILLLIISLILALILLIAFVNYKTLEKKVQVKEVIRELILSIEKAEVNDEIEFNNLDTVSSIKNENGEKLKALSKYKEIDTFIKIENLTLEDARKIINNEVDFSITKDGDFLEIDSEIE